MLTRRRLIRGAAVLAIARPFATTGSEQAAGAPIAAASRVRPRDSGWPSASEWEGLRRSVEGQLIAVQSPLDSCRADPDGDACRDLFTELKNPYFIGDSPALTQTCGWVDAWTAQPSVYAVAAQKTAHVVAAVNFAREKNLRLVVKGGGHSYLGASNAADSLMIWTRAMNDITVHDAFVPEGCAASQAPQPAVTMGGGAIWMRAYGAVTTGAGRYVQGGGCGTVGVAGLVQGGGFGSYSKQFGTAGREPARGGNCDGGRRGSRRQCVQRARPLLGAERWRGRQFRRRHPPHAKDLGPARRLWRRSNDDPREVGRSVSPIAERVRCVLCGAIVQSALGRTGEAAAGQSSRDSHEFPGSRQGAGGSDLGAIPRLGGEPRRSCRGPGGDRRGAGQTSLGWPRSRGLCAGVRAV